MDQDYNKIVSNIKEKLKILKVNDAVVKVCKPPAYLSTFLNSEDQDYDIIFVYKIKILKLDETAAVMKDSSILNGTIDDEELTGQPLEPPVDEMDDLKLEDLSNSLLAGIEPEVNQEELAPLSGYIALQLHNYLNMYLKPAIPVWILIDGTDPQKSVLLGSLKKDEFFTCSWVTVQGKSDTDILDIDAMLNKHRSFTSKKNDEVRLLSEVSCKINVLESKNCNIHGDVFIHAHWKKPSIKIPSVGASLTLEFNIKVGDQSSPLYCLWQQLLLLQKYFYIAVQWKRNNSLPQDRANVILPTSHGIFTSENMELSLQERIIDALMSPQQWSTDYTNTESSLESVLLNIKNGTVPGMDLTARMWILLSESRTYEELVANTMLLFQQARKCLTTKPFISNENKSKMAEAIRILLADPSANPQIMVEPLELLVEIGVENLKNNYIATFVQSGIAKEDLLNVPNFSSFITMDNATWIETISSYTIWMSKIHAIAELVGLAQLGVKVTPDISEIIQRMFVHFLGENSPVISLHELINNSNLTFVTSITSYPGQNTGGPKYEKWLMKLTTKEKFRTVINCFLQTHDYLFPDCMFHFDDKNFTLSSSQTEIALPSVSPDYKWFFANFTSIVTRVGS